jgi:hypothetical protein
MSGLTWTHGTKILQKIKGVSTPNTKYGPSKYGQIRTQVFEAKVSFYMFERR